MDKRPSGRLFIHATIKSAISTQSGLTVPGIDGQVVKHRQRGAKPPKELNMKVYAEGRAPAAPQITGLGDLMPPTTKAPTRQGAAGWAVPAALILLVVIPLATGALRLAEMAGGPKIMPANAQFVATPLPVVVHIVGAAVYALLGAFQFVPGFRRRRPGWHRAAGRLLVLCGLLVGLSGLWMTLFFTRPGGAHELLYAFRLVFGSAMVGSIILGFAAIRRRDVTGHRAWMMRAYAIGLGADTGADPNGRELSRRNAQ